MNWPYLSGFISIISTDLHRNILKKIQSPTLIIVGEDDQSTPLAAAQFLKENIEGSELVVIKSAAHLANIEQHEAFNVALGTHIEKIN